MNNRFDAKKTHYFTRFLALSLLLTAVGNPIAQADKKPAAPPAMPVTVAQPEIRQMAEFDEFTGRFEAYQQVAIQAQVSGYLEAIHFTDGQQVEAGDPLFSIDAKPFQALVDVASAEVSRAESQQILADLEVKRAQRLVKKNAMPQEELDGRLAAVRSANADVKAAKAALKTAQLNLAYTEISAPISGRISDRKIDIGNLIQSGGSQVLTTIVTHQPVYFVFDVAESDYLKYQRRINQGQQSHIADGTMEVKVRLLDEAEFTHVGKLNFIDTQLDQSTSTIRLRAVFTESNEGLLLPGMFGRVQIPVSEVKPTMLIPDKAILSDMANKVVMTVNQDNVVVPKPITLGALDKNGMRVVVSGLENSDRIVVEGLLRARPGAKVAPHEAEPSSTAATRGQ